MEQEENKTSSGSESSNQLLEKTDEKNEQNEQNEQDEQDEQDEQGEQYDIISQYSWNSSETDHRLSLQSICSSLQFQHSQESIISRDENKPSKKYLAAKEILTTEETFNQTLDLLYMDFKPYIEKLNVVPSANFFKDI